MNETGAPDGPSWNRWEVVQSQNKGEWFWFEHLDVEWWFWFTDKIWFPIASILVVLYLGGIILVKWWMSGRKQGFHGLKFPMAVLLLGSALFSLMCVYRILPRTLNVLSQPNGVYQVLCVRNGSLAYEGFWAVWYTLWKSIHLIETFLIILQKRKLSAFHICHHSIMLLLTAYVAPFGEPVTYFQMCVNSLQHSITYPLMACRVMGLCKGNSTRIILVLELTDLSVAISGMLYTLYVIENGGTCLRHPKSIVFLKFALAPMFFLLLQLLYTHFRKRKQYKLIGNDKKQI